MKRLPVLILFFVGSFTNVCAQETSLNLNVLQMMILGEEEVKRRNDALPLGAGEWSSIDRLLGTPRFARAMEYIVRNERTSSLGDLTEISAFYAYLSQHPDIQGSGLRWTKAATIVTGAVLPLWELQSEGTAGLAGLIAVIGKAHDPDNQRTYNELLDMFNEGFSPAGIAFLDGSASKQVLADVTRKYFRPLLEGQSAVSDPFEADAEILYQEQFVTLQPYYSQFTDVDETFILNGMVKAAIGMVEQQSQTGRIDLMTPRGRFKLGMALMGYDAVRVEEWLRGRGL